MIKTPALDCLARQKSRRIFITQLKTQNKMKRKSIFITQLKTQNKMKRKSNLSNLRIQYSNANPVYVNILIQALESFNIPMYESTKAFDSEFPYVVWDGKHITQTRGIDDTIYQVVDSIEEFINALIVPDTQVIQLTEDYTATITADNVKVGCQEISYEKVTELYNIMNNLRS